MAHDLTFAGAAYWASRGASALRALAAQAAEAGMHGNAAALLREAEDCEQYLAAYGLKDTAEFKRRQAQAAELFDKARAARRAASV